MIFIEKTLSAQQHFEGCLLRLEVHQVELPDGSTSVRELVYHPNAVCAVVVTASGEMVFVRQFRKPIEAAILEIPAGKIDPGEDPRAAVERELREEVGFVSGKIEFLMDFYATPGFCNEKLSLYLATEVEMGEQSCDEGEFIELVKVPLAESLRMAMAGELGDAKSVAGVLAAHQRLVAN